MNIGDVFLVLRGDDKQFQADVVKSGDKAAEGFAAQFKAKLGPAIKKAGGALMGAGLGAVFSTAIKGAADLNAAVSSFAADTGATAEEAASAQKVIADSFKNNLQGFGEIGETMAVLRTDMGLTQKQAEKLTPAFLKFGTAAKQNATAATRDFDDILDAWNLTADDSQGIMDKLIVSHQKYGGSIEGNQKALAAMAPQLIALNAGIDDGIGLLNLFASSGLDASAGVKALNFAVKNLKPGETIDSLIAQISAIEDPTLRAQKAIEIFGARGGVALANALKPGITSLGQFAVTEDQAAGATAKAASAVENGFGNQFQLILKKATGALAEFGTAFGPLLIGLASVVPHLRPVLTVLGGAIGKMLGNAFRLSAVSALGDALGSAIGQLRRVPGVGKGLDGLGKFLGSRLGKGLSIAFAAIAVIEVVNTYNDIRNGLNEQAEQIGKDVGTQIASGTLDQLKQSKGALEQGIKELGGVWDFGIFSNEQRDKLQAELDAVNARIEAFATAVPGTVASGLTAGGDEIAKAGEKAGAGAGEGVAAGVDGSAGDVQASVEALVKKFGTSLGGVKRAAKTLGGEAMSSLQQGIHEARQKPADAWDNLMELMKHPLPRWKEQALIIGRLTSAKLQEGLSDSDPEIRAAALATQDFYLTRLKEISPKGAKIGTEAAKLLEKSLRSNNAGIRDAATDARNIVTGKLDDLPGAAAKQGAAAGAKLGPAINSPANRTAIITAVNKTVRLITNLLSGIKADVDVNVSPSYHYPHKATGGPVEAGQTYVVGERQAELFVPEVNGRIVPSVGMAERQGRGGGDTYQITVPVQGLIRAESPDDIARPLRRLAQLGELTGLAPILRRRTTG